MRSLTQTLAWAAGQAAREHDAYERVIQDATWMAEFLNGERQAPKGSTREEEAERLARQYREAVRALRHVQAGGH